MDAHGCLRSVRPGLAACALLLAALTPLAHADPDRERAQMLQMQQQLQRLQSDNAALQNEKSTLAAKAQDADKLKKTSEQAGKELARLRQSNAEQAKELAALRAELAASQAQSQAEIAQLRKNLAERDTALQLAADEKRRGEQSQALLAARLKLQTGRAELCEQRHAAVMKFTAGVIDRYEGDRLRLCEPVTGIWKVKAEEKIQQMREELYTYRLDIPPPPSTAAAEAAPAAH